MEHILRRHIEKIAPLTEDEFALVISKFSIKKFKRHDYIIREGEPVHFNYFIIAGLVKLIHTDDTGKEHIVSFAFEDWWETDFQAFYTRKAATMAIHCIEDTAVFCLSLDGYNELCNDLPRMQQFFMTKASFGHIGSQRRILSLLTTSASERYQLFLIQFPALIQRIPKTLLASYLGVSRETLSRLTS